MATLSWGQAQFVVQNASKTEVYTNINNAIINAVSGDTLYIPGGGFTISNTTITKSLHWVGHGHYPDSTQATMQSRITSALNFNSTCTNSSFEGIYFTSQLLFGSDGIDATNITFKRCRIGSNLYLRAIYDDTPDLNFEVSECVINGTLSARNGTNCHVNKSIIFGSISYFQQSFFKYNDFPAYTGCSNCTSRNRTIQYSKSCTFENNIFAYQFGLYNTESCVLSYNIFDRALPFNEASTHSGNNNIVNVDVNEIFQNITGNIYTFSYDNDYHLKTSTYGTPQDGSPNVLITGTSSDGTNCGIYGTTTPYKTIPYYPHINTATIDNEATNNQLGVEINVKAQSR